MQHLKISCIEVFANANVASARPVPVTIHNGVAPLANRAAPAVGLHRYAFHQRGLTCLPHLRSSRTLECRAAAPQSTKLDSSMIWGDIMMLTATELASERLPKQLTGVLSLTLLAAWIGVSAWWAFCQCT